SGKKYFLTTCVTQRARTDHSDCIQDRMRVEKGDGHGKQHLFPGRERRFFLIQTGRIIVPYRPAHIKQKDDANRENDHLENRHSEHNDRNTQNSKQYEQSVTQRSSDDDGNCTPEFWL